MNVLEKKVCIENVVVTMIDRKYHNPKQIFTTTLQSLMKLGAIEGIDWTSKVKTILAIFPNAVALFCTADKKTSVFREGLVDSICESIVASLDQKKCNFIAENLPNGKNKHFKKNGLIHDIVMRFPQFHVYNGDGKLNTEARYVIPLRVRPLGHSLIFDLTAKASYNMLRKALSQFIDEKKDRGGEDRRLMKIKKGARYVNTLVKTSLTAETRTPEDLEKLLSAPFSDAILNPTPEPVDIAPATEMQYLHDFLRSCNLDNDNQMMFPRGTLCRDGRLDLCKQVIGPCGVNDLQLSLQIDGSSARPKVRHLLLGLQPNLIFDLTAKARK